MSVKPHYLPGISVAVEGGVLRNAGTFLTDVTNSVPHLEINLPWFLEQRSRLWSVKPPVCVGCFCKLSSLKFS